MPGHVPDPIVVLPDHYREVHTISINDQGMLLKLNALSLIPLIAASLITFGALLVYHEEMGAPLVIDTLPRQLPGWVGLALLLMVLPLHELCHGLMIRRYGHHPRYGIKWMVLFATSDGAYFRRAEFIRVALAPLALITIGGALIILLLPQGMAYWVALAIALNAAGSIGDLWMAAVALRFDPSALIRDEADRMRVFAARPSVPLR